jgi:two-component system, cell cycle response regulator DivK
LNPGEGTPNTPKGLYTLIVEDNMDNFVQIRRMLEDIGITGAEWKSSGAGVVQFAETLSQTPDLILLDLGLPGEDGYEILQRLRTIERYKNTRIVAVTGRATLEEMRYAREAGFDAFLGKPLDTHRFPYQIQRILNGEAIWERS